MRVALAHAIGQRQILQLEGWRSILAYGPDDAFGAQRMANFEITPEGNGITLEDEMMKVTTNAMDYQAATTLYTKSIKILKTALGRQA